MQRARRKRINPPALRTLRGQLLRYERLVSEYDGAAFTACKPTDEVLKRALDWAHAEGGFDGDPHAEVGEDQAVEDVHLILDDAIGLAAGLMPGDHELTWEGFCELMPKSLTEAKAIYTHPWEVVSHPGSKMYELNISSHTRDAVRAGGNAMSKAATVVERIFRVTDRLETSILRHACPDRAAITVRRVSRGGRTTALGGEYHVDAGPISSYACVRPVGVAKRPRLGELSCCRAVFSFSKSGTLKNTTNFYAHRARVVCQTEAPMVGGGTAFGAYARGAGKGMVTRVVHEGGKEPFQKEGPREREAFFQVVLNFDKLDPHELNVSLAKEALADVAWPADRRSSKQQAVLKQLAYTVETGCCE